MDEATARRGVTLQYFDGCPHWRTAYERVNEVLGDMGEDDISVALERVESPEDAERLRFVGSPTILVNGEDPFVRESTGGYGLSCRVYQTPEGSAASPTKEQLREVLDDHLTT
jgi:hypothetical protein